MADDHEGRVSMDAALSTPSKAIRVDADVGKVTLPLSAEKFNEFIRGLLGRPQSISRTMAGAFELRAHDFIDLSHLIGQRISQQNDGHLVRFSCKISFSDGSTVILGSLEELDTYQETRNIVSDAAHLSWDFLVQFQDKDYPEHQQIELSVLAGSENPILSEAASSGSEGSQVQDDVHSYVSYTISHTARSWAIDLDGLMSNYLKQVVEPEKKLRRIIRQNAKLVSMAVGVLFLVVASVGWILGDSEAHRQARAAQLEQYQDSDADTSTDLEGIAHRLDFLVKREIDPTNGLSPYHFPVTAGGFVLIYIFTIVLVLVVRWAAKAQKPSFLILTRASEKEKEVRLKAGQRQWFVLVGSLSFGIVVGVSANWIYDILCSWLQ